MVGALFDGWLVFELFVDVVGVADEDEHQIGELVGDAKSKVADDEQGEETKEVTREEEAKRVDGDKESENEVGDLDDGVEPEGAEIQEIVEIFDEFVIFVAVFLAEEDEIDKKTADDGKN